MGMILNLFEGFGVELEYMLVSKHDLSVCPIADKALADVAGVGTNEYNGGIIGWSNELALHILEFKNIAPVAKINSLPALFMNEVIRAQKILDKYDAMLLPTGAHPFMNPHSDTQLWPSENTEIYQAYDRIFDCSGHGWSNLQSTHINLPFNGDEQFGRLHAAIRVIMPLLPALAASTPIIESAFTGFVDTRLQFYKNNQKAIPIIAGSVIPEQVFTIGEYHDKILNVLYKAIAPYDPQGILQEEWLNSRGAIARFDRNAIEIRIVDIQECPSADIMNVEIIVALLKSFTEDFFCCQKQQRNIHENTLLHILNDTIQQGSEAVIDNLEYLNLFGITTPLKAMELLSLALEKVCTPDDYNRYSCYLTSRTISEKIIQKYNMCRSDMPLKIFIDKEYHQLGKCLQNDEFYQ